MNFPCCNVTITFYITILQPAIGNSDETKDYFRSKDVLVHLICVVENDE